MPADKHTGADGLSQKPRAPEDEDPEEDFKEWVDDAMSLMYMEERRPIVRYGAQAGGMREDDGEVRVRMLGAEVLPVDEEGVLPRSDVAKDKDGELHLIKWYLREKKKPKEVDEKKWKRFVSKASKFFLKDDKLWKKQPDGQIGRAHV